MQLLTRKGAGKEREKIMTVLEGKEATERRPGPLRIGSFYQIIVAEE